MRLDNMVKQKPRLRLSVLLMTIFAYLTASVPAMSYEEPEYCTVKKLKFMTFVNTKSGQLQKLYIAKRVTDLGYSLNIYQEQIKALKKSR